MSSSSSFADSDSTSSFLTPSLEFPDRISFREMDLSEAGPSSRDRISFRIQGVEGEIDRINLSPGVFGPDDLAISLEACKKRSFSDSHKVQAQHLSEAGPSGVVVASSSTNQDIAELMPSELSEIGNLSTPVDRVVVYGGTPGTVENRRGIERTLTIFVKSKGYLVPNDVVAVGGGIKGVRPVNRPPVLKPPPAMKRPPIDLRGSSWDFLTHFAPSETVKRPSSSSSSSENGCDEEEAKEEELETEETGARFIQLGDTADEACSFTTNEGDSSRGRDAARNINYDVASCSSSSAEDLSVSTTSLMTRSLEFPEPTSFRIGGGGEGEMDRIYRSLGVSGPDDLAISFDAWEACKKRSSSDVVNRFKSFDLDNYKVQARDLNHPLVRRPLSSMGSGGSGGPYHPCEIMTELVTQLLIISGRSWRYTNTAKQLITLIESNRPMISKIQYSGVELPNHRQAQIRMFVEKLEKGKKLTDKVLSSRRWNLYRQLTLARKMEQLEKTISGICKDAVFTHILADVHNLLAVRWSSSSSSSVNSESTCSFLTPSLEFPDRISFREMDLSKEGPSGTVVNRENIELTRSESIEIRHFTNPEDMVLVTSWLKGQLLGRGSFGSIYEGMSIDGDFFAVSEVSLLDQGSQAKECIHQLEAETTLLSQLQHHNIMSSSSSFADSDSTCSFLTPSLEFPDRISFREMDLSEAGPCGTVADRKIRVPPSLSRFEIVEVE